MLCVLVRCRLVAMCCVFVGGVLLLFVVCCLEVVDSCLCVVVCVLVCMC